MLNFSLKVLIILVLLCGFLLYWNYSSVFSYLYVFKEFIGLKFHKSTLDTCIVFFLILLVFLFMDLFFFLLQGKRGEQIHVQYLDETRVMLKYILPLSEVVIDFYDQLKSASSGYAR